MMSAQLAWRSIQTLSKQLNEASTFTLSSFRSRYALYPNEMKRPCQKHRCGRGREAFNCGLNEGTLKARVFGAFPPGLAESWILLVIIGPWYSPVGALDRCPSPISTMTFYENQAFSQSMEGRMRVWFTRADPGKNRPQESNATPVALYRWRGETCGGARETRQRFRANGCKWGHTNAREIRGMTLQRTRRGYENATVTRHRLLDGRWPLS
ncbi:hypothetical protein F5148DRAFT_335231 [Russula earlei]|uniref:Uncharacterized protein n=1 Tax=Russula earlei TaxID=71964 RepID=A0ACC0U2I7_9AGAM|nr:hypothetical protein F5148DRAFT_335231 [Russula earlei]